MALNLKPGTLCYVMLHGARCAAIIRKPSVAHDYTSCDLLHVNIENGIRCAVEDVWIRNKDISILDSLDLIRLRDSIDKLMAQQISMLAPELEEGDKITNT